MKSRFVATIAALLFVAASQTFAQNAISIKECVIESAKVSKIQPELEPYILRLKLRCTLASQEAAYLKVAVDPKEEQNFQTVAGTRLRKGRSILLELEIPIEDWRTEKLNVFLLMQGKDANPDNTPLASVTKIVEKISVKKD